MTERRITVRRPQGRPDSGHPPTRTSASSDRPQTRIVVALLFASMGLSLFDLYQLGTLMAG